MAHPERNVRLIIMALINRLQWRHLRFRLGQTWVQLLFVTVLMVFLLLSALRQDSWNAVAKSSGPSKPPEINSHHKFQEQPWNTVYETETLARHAQDQALSKAHALNKPKRKTTGHKASTASPTGESLFIQTYNFMNKGQHGEAMQVAQTMAERFPHFQLGQLLYADLGASAAGLAPQLDALLLNPEAQKRLGQLKTEAIQRTRHAGTADFSGKVPSIVRHISPKVTHLVVVDAEKSRLYLLTQRSNGSGKSEMQMVFDAYVSVGNQGMGKWREGDAKTPAGVYFIQKHLTEPMLPDLYGSGALTLDYPNQLDKQFNRTGSGIWLHGSPSHQYARPPNATDGCVVLANDDMTRLVQHGMRADTPVIIAERLRWVDADQPPTNSLDWPRPEHTRQSPGDWALVSAFEWTDQGSTVAVLSHELQAPNSASKRHHSYWIKTQQQWKEVSNPL